MNSFKNRLLESIYGEKINDAIVFDEILKQLSINEKLYKIDLEKIKTKSLTSQSAIEYLCKENLIIHHFGTIGGKGPFYEITTKGRLRLSSGGFTSDATKSKNDIFILGISLSTLAVSIIALLVSLKR